MITYYEEQMPEEQTQITECIQTLLKQTFILERKYDRRTERFLMNKDFRICNKHLEFLKEYFRLGGMELCENSQMGIFYIKGETVLGEKIPKLATLYLLILKLIYDEQMTAVSNSVNVVTTLGQINEVLGSYRLLRSKPSFTEIRRAIALLKKYQIIEPLDVLETIDGDGKLIIYPTIQVVLFGDEIRGLLQELGERDEEPDDEQYAAIQNAGDSEKSDELEKANNPEFIEEEDE